MLESLPFLVLMLGTHRGSTLLIGAVSTPFGCLGDTLHESLRQQVLHDWRHQQSRFEQVECRNGFMSLVKHSLLSIASTPSEVVKQVLASIPSQEVFNSKESLGTLGICRVCIISSIGERQVSKLLSCLVLSCQTLCQHPLAVLVIPCMSRFVSKLALPVLAWHLSSWFGFWLSAHLQFASHCWHKLSVAFAGLSSLSWCVLSIYSL
jgi:hypothetical protein